MAASAHLLLPALSKPEAEPTAYLQAEPSALPHMEPSAYPEAGPSAASDLQVCVFSAEGACAEAPLTSEPPLPDAEPLTSEPPLADAAPLTSESDALAEL
ncbi:hypothetical protein [Streptomyces sp. NL15-2K]|uniref:hypothetical protein n=1 Tax=Streptomyces sp. NL15-2K TaxID=376149 RepID=UPI000F57A622|nr:MULTISPECIES: hypothetical protein [Actinomycetes]WKX09141.1 hypothetical protein Q4V64_17230 [Kutzneria buriramensis]GCB49353.1 hypothetical protein SNL152K_6688 [Streptomyces sp. NL15-2K]